MGVATSHSRSHSFVKASVDAFFETALLSVLAYFVFGGYFWACLKWLVTGLVTVAEFLLVGASWLLAGAWSLLAGAWDVIVWALENSWVVAFDAHVTGLGLTSDVWYSGTARLIFFAAWVFGMRFFALTRMTNAWAQVGSGMCGLAVFLPLVDQCGGWWRLAYIPIMLLTVAITQVVIHRPSEIESEELCAQVIRLYKKGLTATQIAAKTGVSYPTVRDWIDDYKSRQANGRASANEPDTVDV